MRMHIIGIATTFMTGLAILARHAGHEVSGSDSCIDLPTRKQLEEAGIILKEGFSAKNIEDNPELVIIGNELSSNNEELLATRKKALPYISGSLWLEEYVLHDKWQHSSMPPHDDKLSKELHTPSKPSDKPSVKRAPRVPLDPHEKLNQRILR